MEQTKHNWGFTVIVGTITLITLHVCVNMYQDARTELVQAKRDYRLSARAQ